MLAYVDSMCSMYTRYLQFQSDNDNNGRFLSLKAFILSPKVQHHQPTVTGGEIGMHFDCARVKVMKTQNNH